MKRFTFGLSLRRLQNVFFCLNSREKGCTAVGVLCGWFVCMSVCMSVCVWPKNVSLEVNRGGGELPNAFIKCRDPLIRVPQTLSADG